MPAMARPADWLEPMQSPAMAAAYQKPPLVVVVAAITQVAIQPTRVVPSAILWPMRSCR